MGSEPTAVLAREIDAQLAEFTGKRRRDKRKAFALKLGAAALGAGVTILLGLKTEVAVEKTLKNIALVAGALVGLLNAWDAFFDHRALWVKRTQTVARLRCLKRSFELSVAKADGSLDAAAVDAFKADLDQIVEDDLSSWVQMRTENESTSMKPRL
jgi:dihydroxyacetone kinase DhaKLM complex PTS-EIIA-like component DhaM